MQGANVEAMATASREWRTHLIDVGGSNRLLHFRPTASTVRLHATSQSALTKLLSGKPVRLAEFFATAEGLQKANRACSALARKEREAREEFGVSVAFLCIGTATWDPEASQAIIAAENEQEPDAQSAPTSGRPKYTRPSAPVLLRPVELNRVRGTQDSWELRLADDFALNGVLSHVMNADHRRLDEEAILDLDDGSPAGITEMLDAVEEACADVAEFSIDRQEYLGAFSYLKQPMVADVDNLDALSASDLVAALAGDSEAASRVRGQRSDVSERTPDYVPVESEFLILDADASQSYVVNAVVGGSSLVVQGPPGTGKSQTIANTIASLVAADKKVLFVAQKRAAVTAVLDRLEGAQLGHLVLDLFAATGSRRFVADALRDVLERQHTTGIPDVASLEFTLTKSRTRLVSHNEALSRTDRGWGVSVSTLRSKLPRIPSSARSSLRLNPHQFAAWTASSQTEYGAALDELHSLGALTPSWTDSPGWKPQELRTTEAVSHSTNLARTLASEDIPLLLESLSKECTLLGEMPPTTWSELDDLTRYVQEIHVVESTVPSALSPTVSDDELDSFLCVTDRAFAKTSGKHIGWLEKRSLKKQVRAFNASLSSSDVHQWLLRSVAIRRSWRGSGPAHITPELIDHLASAHALRSKLTQLEGRLQGVDFHALPLVQTVQRLKALVEDPKRHQMPRAAALETQLSVAGLTPVTRHLRETLRQAESLDFAPSSFLDWVVTMSLLEDAQTSDAALAGITGKDLDEATVQFSRADAEHLKANSARLRRRAAEQLKHTLDAHPDEHSILKTELTRKRNFRSVRTLFSEAQHVVLGAKPVWAMSPLQVSRLLPAEQCFDVVIFDEASQIKPADAIPALMRANQAVVAGDSRQLPPTDFFSKVLEDLPAQPGQNSIEDSVPEEDASLDSTFQPAVRAKPTGSLTQDAESILFAMERLLVGQSRSLLWHYRSRDERLIAVSNAHVYSGSLTTFPAADTLDAIRHVAVEPSLGINHGTNSPGAEVDRVVELVREHITEHPDESLGVIAFGIKHQNRLEAALDRARAEDPTFDTALSSLTEAFFVKSIERVQGDERDAIILTVGYGKGLDGKMRYFWGPLLKEGGERRLNVAISRARNRMTLVTSFTADDISEDAHPSAGFNLMYRFLRFVSSQGTELHGGADNTVALNPFEIDIRDQLTAAGLHLDAQVGVGSYRIDFAARHPDFPGRHVLAIEADGASYHSGHITRERDRLRQTLLEQRGWTFHRIWSTDWFNDADAEVRKTVSAFEAAIAQSEAQHSPQANNQPAPTPERTWQVHEQAATLPMPAFTPGNPIDTYSPALLKQLVVHVRSDGKLRTADDELDLVKAKLGFAKRGSRIVAAIKEAQRKADGTRDP